MRGMDKQLDKAICNFWSDLRGTKTDELYEEYLRVCAEDNVKPRPKSVIVREACEMTECIVEKKQKLITVKFFVPKDESRRDEWRARVKL